MWKYDYDDYTGTAQFTSHYEDLKKAMGRTLTPRLPIIPLASTFPYSSPTPEDTSDGNYTVTSEDLSLDLGPDSDALSYGQSFLDFRTRRLGERPLPTPRTPTSDNHPPTPRGLLRTPRTPRTLDNYPPSPRSRSSSPPKTPRNPRHGSQSPRRAPRRSHSAGDLRHDGYHSARRSFRERSPDWNDLLGFPTPRSSRMPKTQRNSGSSRARSPRKSIDKPFAEVFRPPPHLDLPLSARSDLSSMLGSELFPVSGRDHVLESGLSYYYPEEVRDMLTRGGLPPEEEEGWTRREKLLIVLLLFTVVTVIVLFLVIFLVMSGVLGGAKKTEVYNYNQSDSLQSIGSGQNVPFHPVPPGTMGTTPPVFVSPHMTQTTAVTNTSVSGGSATQRTPVLPGVTGTTAATSKRTSTVTTTKSPPFAPTTTSARRPATERTTPRRTSSTSSPTTTPTPTRPTAQPRTTTPKTGKTTTTTSTTTTTRKPPQPPSTTTTTSTTTITTTTTTTTTTTPTTTKAPLGCFTDKCVQVGDAIKTSLGQSTGDGTCMNFYGHACGKNAKSASSRSTFSEEFSPLFNVVLEDLYKMTADVLASSDLTLGTKAEKIAKAMYASCMATNSDRSVTTAIEEMTRVFSDLGFNLNLTSGKSIDVMLQTSRMQYGAGPLFKLTREPVSDGVRFKYMPMISPPSLVLDTSYFDYATTPNAIKQVEDSYILTISNELYSWFAVSSTVDPPSDLSSSLNARVRQVLAFEKLLRQAVPESTSDWTELTTETMTVAQLQKLVPNISWTLVLNLRPNDQVRVYDKNYLSLLKVFLEGATEEVVKTYIFYHVLFSHTWRFAPVTMRETLLGYLKDNSMIYSGAHCAKLTFDLAFQETVQLLMTSEMETFLAELDFPESVTSKLVPQLETALNGLSWLSNVTRSYLINKISMLSSLSPDFSNTAETAHPDFTPDVSINNTFVVNAINQLRARAGKEELLDRTTVNLSKQRRFEFSPLYSASTNTLHFPLAFIHLGSWLRDSPDLLPLYKYLLTRSVLVTLLDTSISDPSSGVLLRKQTCFSNNVPPRVSNIVEADFLLSLQTAAVALQYITKNQSTGPSEEFTMGNEVFTNKEFHFYLLAQGYCAGDIYDKLGITHSRRPMPQVELNYAITNDQSFQKTFMCEPGLPMAGISSCSWWN